MSIKSFCLSILFLSVSLMGSDHYPCKKVMLADFPAEDVDDILVPVPSEIFSVLDKLGTPNWQTCLQNKKFSTPKDRIRTALLLGNIIAEGFVAVEAEDVNTVSLLGRQVLKLAEAINVRKSVISRSQSIIDKAHLSDWQGVRDEFDGALHDVRTAMQELNDEELSQFVSLGGWLRGTEVLTLIVEKNYSAEGADLLHQPQLINYFEHHINCLNKRLKHSILIDHIRETLQKIAPLIATGSAKITPEKVKLLHVLTKNINRQILGTF